MYKFFLLINMLIISNAFFIVLSIEIKDIIYLKINNNK